jgi:hypothetical protein
MRCEGYCNWLIHKTWDNDCWGKLVEISTSVAVNPNEIPTAYFPITQLERYHHCGLLDVTHSLHVKCMVMVYNTAQRKPTLQYKSDFIALNCSILLHCASLALRSRFFAVYLQRRLIFCHRFLFIDTTCFGLTGYHQVYRLLWWRNLDSWRWPVTPKHVMSIKGKQQDNINRRCR